MALGWGAATVQANSVESCLLDYPSLVDAIGSVDHNPLLEHCSNVAKQDYDSVNLRGEVTHACCPCNDVSSCLEQGD
jgi:hypothetical protein